MCCVVHQRQYHCGAVSSRADRKFEVLRWIQPNVYANYIANTVTFIINAMDEIYKHFINFFS